MHLVQDGAVTRGKARREGALVKGTNLTVIRKISTRDVMYNLMTIVSIF